MKRVWGRLGGLLIWTPTAVVLLILFAPAIGPFLFGPHDRSSLGGIDAETPAIVERARSGDPAGALESARVLADRYDGRRVLCHDLYLQLGLAAGGLEADAEELLSLALPRADLANQQCEAGYLYGVLIEKLRLGALSTEGAVGVCRWLAARGAGDTDEACLRGLGRGLGLPLAIAAGSSFAEGGATCEAAERSLGVGRDDPAAGSCVGGLVLEYFERRGADETAVSLCLPLAPPGHERCLDVFAEAYVFAALEPFALNLRPAAAEICGRLTGRAAWSCRGVVGGSAANSGVRRGSAFLVERLGRACRDDLRCLTAGIAGAALLQGPLAAREFCGLLAGAADCAFAIGAGLRDHDECALLPAGEPARCRAGALLGWRALETIVPPPAKS
jgi:hypothetical protein